MTVTQTASEKAIEDILSRLPSLLQELVPDVHSPLRLIERQQTLPSGRADMIFLAGEEVLLIELKVVVASEDHVAQLSGYRDDYEKTADGTEFASERPLRPILLSPEIPSSIESICSDAGLEPVEYSLNEVLGTFQRSMFTDLKQFQVEGDVTSVAQLGYINGYLEFLAEQNSPVTVADAAEHYDEIGKGTSSVPRDRIRKFLRQARKLDLVSTNSGTTSLTKRGERYVTAGDQATSQWHLNTKQAEIVKDLLYDDVFYSDLTYSMAALLQSVFELSKNSHPVPRAALEDWYAKKVGKAAQWNERSRTDAVRWIGAYVEELGLVTIVEKSFYITPEGFDLLAHISIDEGKSLIRSQTN